MKTGCGANEFVPDIETEDKGVIIMCGSIVLFRWKKLRHAELTHLPLV